MDYQAKISTPFGMLGIRCDDEALLGIDFLPADDAPQQATCALATAICVQLRHYFDDPASGFHIPLKSAATQHQQSVRQAMLAIPCGKTKRYGELASELHSSAQAVGQACGANPFPIVIPCHRVVAKAGLGGFMKHTSGKLLAIKRWLLAHEGVL